MGLGCIGSLLTKYLIKNEQLELYYFNRSIIDTIKISHQEQTDVIKIKLTQDKVTLDWLIISLKEHQIGSAKEQLSNLITPDTKLAIFRNGLDLSADFTQFTSTKNILPTIINCSVQRNPDQSLLQLRKPKITLPANDLAKAFTALLPNANLEIIKSNNFLQAQWIKLIESSSIGSLQCYRDQNCSIFKEQKNIEQLKLLIHEAIKVGNAEGVKFPVNFAANLLLKIKAYPDTKGSSMLNDQQAQRPLALGAKLGVIVSKAKENKISTPISSKIYQSLLP